MNLLQALDEQENLSRNERELQLAKTYEKLEEDAQNKIAELIESQKTQLEAISAILEQNLMNLSSAAEKRNRELLESIQSEVERLSKLEEQAKNTSTTIHDSLRTVLEKANYLNETSRKLVETYHAKAEQLRTERNEILTQTNEQFSALQAEASNISTNLKEFQGFSQSISQAKSDLSSLSESSQQAQETLKAFPKFSQNLIIGSILLVLVMLVTFGGALWVNKATNTNAQALLKQELQSDLANVQRARETAAQSIKAMNDTTAQLEKQITQTKERLIQAQTELDTKLKQVDQPLLFNATKDRLIRCGQDICMITTNGQQVKILDMYEGSGTGTAIDKELLRMKGQR